MDKDSENKNSGVHGKLWISGSGSNLDQLGKNTQSQFRGEYTYLVKENADLTFGVEKSTGRTPTVGVGVNIRFGRGR